MSLDKFNAPETLPTTIHGAKSRRSFLKLMASSGAMAGFTRLLWPSVCEAQVASPLRFVGFWQQHGKLDEYWQPKGGETDFDIDFQDSTLQALQPFRDQILILDGLDYRVLYEYGTSGHEGGPVTFLTGSPVNLVNGEALPKSESIDQFLATRIGGATRFRSLQMIAYVQFNVQSVYSTVSFGAGGSRLPFERNPRQVWTRVFSALMTGAPSEAELRATSRKKSLLDYLVRDATRLQSKLAGPERAKLDTHLSALRDIEKRLNGNATTCAPPGQPAAQTNNQLDDLNRVPMNMGLMMDLAVQAFACDLTRVITMPLISQPTAPWLGITQNVHDDLAHYVNEPTNKLVTRSRLNNFHRWHTEQVARFMGGLKNITEGMGNVLDHSLILWGNELGDPAVHESHGVPWVIAGGTNGKFRMGRYLKLRPGKNPLQGWFDFGDKCPNAVPHNKVLVSIAQAFDQNVQTFGHPDYVGPLTQLT